MRLKDMRALVTGASGGLGAAICEQFAREGAHCVVVYRSDRAEGEKTAAKVRSLNRQAEIVKADVGDQEQVESMFEAAEKAFGGLDIVVANAGFGSVKPLLQTTVEDFEGMIRTNLVGTYLTVRCGAERMAREGHGKIITMSSVHGLGGTHYCSLYESTKAGIINFTRGAAFDLSEYNIQINCIAPGAVPVPKDPPPDQDSDLYRAWMQYTPLARFGTPWDVARTAVFLASADSDWITGQVISVDGGITAGPHIPSLRHYGPKAKME